MQKPGTFGILEYSELFHNCILTHIQNPVRFTKIGKPCVTLVLITCQIFRIGIIKSCNDPRPPTTPTTSHKFSAITHDYPETVIISLLPPTTTHDQPLLNQQYPRTILQLQPFSQPQIVNYVFVTTAHPGEFQEQFKFTRHFPPNTNKFSFSESRNCFHSQFSHQ